LDSSFGFENHKWMCDIHFVPSLLVTTVTLSVVPIWKKY
jgi:hypothetical protein